MGDELDSLLAEQVAYYRARAPEYDATSPIPADEPARRALVDAIDAFAPRGRVLELACGTGQWTPALAAHADALTAVDSSPEMLALASARVGGDHVRFTHADLFTWEPDGRYDVVFFAAWLSHVPPERFERFWSLVAESLTATGRVFVIDELPAVAALEQPVPGTDAVTRPLRSGARFRAVKVFYAPGELEARLAALGWGIEVHPVGWRYFYATGART